MTETEQDPQAVYNQADQPGPGAPESPAEPAAEPEPEPPVEGQGTLDDVAGTPAETPAEPDSVA